MTAVHPASKLLGEWLALADAASGTRYGVSGDGAHEILWATSDSEPFRHLAVFLGPATSSDEAFIAASRTAVPKLLTALEKVLELHQRAYIQPLTEKGELDYSAEPIMAYCPECTPDSTVDLIDDCEWTEDWETVPWPCPTVAALNEALETNE